jgi:spermidine/putrescine transport system substrate-binding protein
MSSLEGLVGEFLRGAMSRRQFLQRAVGLGLTASSAGAILAACGSKEAEPATSPTPLDTTLPDKLILYNWTEYMPDSILKSFQKEYGVKVVQSYFDDNEALLAKMKITGGAGYDIIIPSDYMVEIMIHTNLLQPLQMEYIPNFKYVGTRFKNPVYDNTSVNDGRKYSVPYQWGITGIGHRTDIIPEPITKWQDLWNPKYKQQIVMLNDERDTIGAALLTLGYSLNCKDQTQLDEGTAKSIAQKPLVKAYDSVNTKRQLVSGVPLVQGWTGYILAAYDALGRKNVTLEAPQEGFCLWIDNAAIPVGAPHPYAAHLFLNYILEPHIAAELVDYVWFCSPVPEARKYSDPIVWKFVPSDAVLERGQVLRDLGTFNRQWTQAWEKVKSA